jgi:hypothetical protein
VINNKPKKREKDRVRERESERERERERSIINLGRDRMTEFESNPNSNLGIYS